MSLTVSQRALIALALVMLVWYVVGIWYNRRRSMRTLNWLREGLRGLGGQLQASWIGSAASGAQIMVSGTSAPIHQLEASFLLESRELLPLWLVNRLRGRRDELIIRIQLRSARQGEVEVVVSGSRCERSLRQDSRSTWQWQDGPFGLRVAHQGRGGQALSAAVLPFLHRYGPFLRRFSWRREKPHLVLYMRLAGLTECPAADFFSDMVAVLQAPRH